MFKPKSQLGNVITRRGSTLLNMLLTALPDSSLAALLKFLGAIMLPGSVNLITRLEVSPIFCEAPSLEFLSGPTRTIIRSAISMNASLTASLEDLWESDSGTTMVPLSMARVWGAQHLLDRGGSTSDIRLEVSRMVDEKFSLEDMRSLRGECEIAPCQILLNSSFTLSLEDLSGSTHEFIPHEVPLNASLTLTISFMLSLKVLIGYTREITLLEISLNASLTLSPKVLSGSLSEMI